MRSDEMKEAELLRRHLLGELDAEEAHTLEGRLLADDELFELAEAVEGDLLAASAQDELAPGEQEKVLRRLAASPQGRARLALARDLGTLARRREERPMPPPRPFPRPRPLDRPYVRAAALAASLILMIGSLWIARQAALPDGRTLPNAGSLAKEAPAGVPVPLGAPRPAPVQSAGRPAGPPSARPQEERSPAPAPSPTPPEQIAEQQPPEPAFSPVQVFRIPSEVLRSAGPSTIFEVASQTQRVELQVQLPIEEVESFVSFKAVLKGTVQEAWEDLEPKMSEGVPVVILSIPASKIPSGKYELELYGRTRDGGSDLVVAQRIEVRRSEG